MIKTTNMKNLSKINNQNNKKIIFIIREAIMIMINIIDNKEYLIIVLNIN
jgi:hypothetical protein